MRRNGIGCHFDSNGGRGSWSWSFVNCACECLWCTACHGRKTPFVSFFEAQWEHPLRRKFHPHDGSHCWFTATCQRRSSCPIQNLFEDDSLSTPCFLSSWVPQEAWGHQHPIDHPARVHDIWQHRVHPTQEIVPWGFVLSKNKSLSNWNKMVKPSARDFKPFVCNSSDGQWRMGKGPTLRQSRSQKPLNKGQALPKCPKRTFQMG